LLQLGRGLSTAERPRDADFASALRQGFNWAAVFRPRKARRCPRRAARRDRLQLGRGLSTAESLPAACDSQPTNQLQLGRGLSTAERIQEYKIPRETGNASIGPRSFDRGKGGVRPGNVRREYASIGPRSFDRWAAVFRPRKGRLRLIGIGFHSMLQLGRGLSTAESVVVGSPTTAWLPLQLGRGLSTAERTTTREGSTLPLPLQLGRGLSTAESHYNEQAKVSQGW